MRNAEPSGGMMRIEGSGGRGLFASFKTCLCDAAPQQFVNNAIRERVTIPERTITWHRAAKRTCVDLIIVITVEALNTFSISQAQSVGKKVPA
jgi:hypothetical protein